MLDDKCCGTCKYKYIIRKDSRYMNNVCFNDKSEHCADYIEYNDSCEEWERKQAMKYKVGDRVRVRRDLKNDVGYGSRHTVKEMMDYKGNVVTISEVRTNCYWIEEDKKAWDWTDEMFDGLVEEELTAEEAIKIFGKICCETRCTDECPIYKAKKGMSCRKFRKDKPEEVLEILKQQKKNHEKKETKTEIVDLIKVMKEVCDDETCIYAYEIDVNKEDINDKMKELVKEYSGEQDSKIYAKYERICRVKS